MIDGRIDRQKYDGQKYRRKGGQIKMYRLTNGWSDKQTDGWMYRQTAK